VLGKRRFVSHWRANRHFPVCIKLLQNAVYYFYSVASRIQSAMWGKVASNIERAVLLSIPSKNALDLFDNLEI